MTSIGTLRELDQAVEEALSDERTCEQEDAHCEVAAAWFRIMACGCHVKAVCHPHKMGLEPWNPHYRCTTCGPTGPKSECRWEPIR